MKQIDVGIIGTGWCGGIRAETCAAHPLVRAVLVNHQQPLVAVREDVEIPQLRQRREQGG